MRGIWQPFQEKLLAEGRRLGVSRRKAWAHSVPVILVLTCVVMALAGFLSRLVWHVSIGVTVVITVLAAPAFWWLVETAGTDALTSAGDDIAAQWRRARPAQFPGGQFSGGAAPGGLPGGLDPASLERHAFAASQGLGTGGAEPGMMFSLAGLTLALIIVAVLITMDEAAWATGPVVIAMVAMAAVLITKGMGSTSRSAAWSRSRSARARGTCSGWHPSPAPPGRVRASRLLGHRAPGGPASRPADGADQTAGFEA